MMKSALLTICPVLTACSVMVLGDFPDARAAGFWGEPALFSGGDSPEATGEIRGGVGPVLDLGSFDAATAVQADARIEQVQFMEPPYVSPAPRAESGVRPGAGAFGGDNAWAGTISFNQDTFFGFYPVIQGAYALNDRWDVTVYSIIWTTNLLSVGSWATDPDTGDVVRSPTQFGPWTEFGAGLNYKALDGALNINPQIGILNGGLLSQPTAARVFDGFVPSIISTYENDSWESEFYMGYYFGARGVTNNDFLHWWYNMGYRPWSDRGGFLSTQSYGVHYEMLRRTGPVYDPGDVFNLYSWIGPYWQTRFANGLVMRYSAGWNANEWGNFVNEAGAFPNFYKVNIAYDF